MLIVLEGIDNCGKTTISNLLKQFYTEQNKTVHVSKELTTDIGSVIKTHIKKGGLSPILKTFLFAADRQLRLEQLREAEFDILIMDRYLYSAIVYREVEGLEGNWVNLVNKYVPSPDISFYIDITAEESIRRNTDSKFNIIYTREFLNKVRMRYIEKCKNGELITINGMQAIEGVFNDITRYLLEYGK